MATALVAVLLTVRSLICIVAPPDDGVLAELDAVAEVSRAGSNSR